MKSRTAKRTFLVGIRKDYYPREIWPTAIGESYIRVYKQEATSRTEAANKVWCRYGVGLLHRMLGHVRKVSLEVNEPAAGVGGLLGRLTPILVYTKIP